MTPVQSWVNFSPLELFPLLWLDASDTSTITQSSNLVSQWNDKSGYARHMTQGTSVNQPTTGASVNGLNAITFGSAAGMATASFSLAQPMTVVAVFRTASNFSSSPFSAFAILVQDNSASGTRPIWFMRRDGPNQPALYAGTLGLAGPALTNSTSYVHTGQINGASSIFRFNGTARTLSANPGASTITTGLQVGGNTNTVRIMSDLCELILLGPLSSAQIIALENYLNVKWAVY
jgi:hypothetical protein